MSQILTQGKCTEGGWEDFIRKIKSIVDTDNQLDYSLLMSLYISGIKAEEAVKRMGEKK